MFVLNVSFEHLLAALFEIEGEPLFSTIVDHESVPRYDAGYSMYRLADGTGLRMTFTYLGKEFKIENQTKLSAEELRSAIQAKNAEYHKLGWPPIQE